MKAFRYHVSVDGKRHDFYVVPQGDGGAVYRLVGFADDEQGCISICESAAGIDQGPEFAFETPAR